MKKNIYNASFAESTNLVDEKYIDESVKNGKSSVVRKRTLGVLVTMLFTLLASFVLRLAEVESPYSKQVLFSKLEYLWYVLSIIGFLYYCFRLIQLKKKPIVKNYLFNQTMFFLVSIFSILVGLFMIFIATIVTDSIYVGLAYILVLIFIAISRNAHGNTRIREQIYGGNEKDDGILKAVNSFSNIASKYGSLIVLLLFLLRKMFDFGSANSIVQFDLLQQLAGGLSPFITVVLIYFLIAMKKEILKGYYLEKYLNEYQEKYDLTEIDHGGIDKKE